jgi:Uma2 family endonuclease
MGTITPARPTDVPSPCLVALLYRLSVRQYDRMILDGTIAGDERVELIDGLLVSKLGKSRSHIGAGNKGLRILWRMVPPGWHVVKGGPIVVSDWSKPEPDLAVVRGEVEDYDECDVTAADVSLVVAIADASLPADRTDRTRVYATGGIPVYWIVNLVDRQIEVFSDPGPDGYQTRQVLGPGQDVPVVVLGVEAGWVAVTDILP